MKFGFTDLSRDEAEKLVFGWKNLFVTLWREIFPLMRANLCFLLFCLPVVTVPPALTALYGICVDAIRGKKCSVFRTYLQTIREQFLPSWGLFLVLGLVEAVSVCSAGFYFRLGGLLFGLFGLLATAIGVIGLLMIPNAFTMLARVDLPLGKVLKNALLLSFLNLKFGICGGVLAIALLLIQGLFWLYLIPLILAIGLALTVYLGTYFSLYGLQTFVLTEEL